MSPGRLRGLLWTHALLICTASIAAGHRPWWPLFVAAAIAATAIGAVLYRHDAVSMKTVLLLALAYRAAWVWLPPALSDDIYRYVWDGLLVTSGISPYAWLPSAASLRHLQALDLFRQLNSAEFYSIYPPVSQWAFGFAAWISADDPVRTRIAIKVLFVSAEIVGLLLLSRRVSAKALQLYAWHPVVLIAAAGQAHTEALMLPLLIAAALWGRTHRVAASVAVSLAGLVKLYPLFLLPWSWWHGRWRAVLCSIGVAGAITFPLWVPGVVGHVQSSLDLYVRWFEFNSGFYYAVKGVFRWATGEDWSKQIGPAFRIAFIVTMAVIYVVAAWRRWSLARLGIWIIGAFLVFSTTVHPWYIVGVLALLPILDRPGWHWQWLGAWSIGTYLLYVDGPYWSFVWIGWIGFAVLGLVAQRQRIVHLALDLRALGKYRAMETWLPRAGQILDLGGGEGHLARRVAKKTQADVTVAEVRQVDTRDVPLLLFDGRSLPCADRSFDAVLLSFVLHHASDADRLFVEAVRVARDRIIVLESTYRFERERRVLAWLDPLVNRIRSEGAMSDTADFRTGEMWRQLFLASGCEIEAEREWANPLHRKHLFVLRVPTSAPSSG